MKFLDKIIFFYYREYKLNMSGIQDILTNIIFFFVSIFIFIFSIGPDKETISLIGVGIIWTLLLLRSTLSLRKFYQEDFENGNLLIIHLVGSMPNKLQYLSGIILDQVSKTDRYTQDTDIKRQEDRCYATAPRYSRRTQRSDQDHI